MARGSAKTIVVADWRDQLHLATLCVVLAAVAVVVSIAVDLPAILRVIIFVTALALFVVGNLSLRQRVVVQARVVVVDGLGRSRRVPVKEITGVDAGAGRPLRSPCLVLRDGTRIKMSALRRQRLSGGGRSVRMLGELLDVDVTGSTERV